jgi:hypothetical protein
MVTFILIVMAYQGGVTAVPGFHSLEECMLAHDAAIGAFAKISTIDAICVKQTIPK